MSHRILVVEDQARLSTQLSAQLLAAGFTVQTTGTGPDSLQVAAQMAPRPGRAR